TNPTVNGLVSENVFETEAIGVDVSRYNTVSASLSGIEISYNSCYFDDTNASGDLLKTCFVVEPSGSTYDVRIVNNDAVKVGTSIASVFVRVFPNENHIVISDIEVNDNRVLGFTQGIQFRNDGAVSPLGTWNLGGTRSAHLQMQVL